MSKRGRVEYEDSSMSHPLSMDGKGSELTEADIPLDACIPEPDAIVIRRQLAMAARVVAVNAIHTAPPSSLFSPDSYKRMAPYKVTPLLGHHKSERAAGVLPTSYTIWMSLPRDAELQVDELMKLRDCGNGWSLAPTVKNVDLKEGESRLLIQWTLWSTLGPKPGYTTQVTSPPH